MSDEEEWDGEEESGEQQAAAGVGGAVGTEGCVSRSSFYRGVCKGKDGRWIAQIKADGRQQHIGTYNTEEAAARAYDEKAKQVHDNPILNFLPDGSLNPDRKLKPRLVKAPKRPSSYRGVAWNHGRWGAIIGANGGSQWVGTFATEEAAARAYDEKAKQVYDNPILNFLPDGSLNPDRKKLGGAASSAAHSRGGADVNPPVRARGARHPTEPASASSSLSDASAQGNGSGGGGGGNGDYDDDEEDAATTAVKEEETEGEAGTDGGGGSSSSSSSSSGLRRPAKEEEDDDAVTIGVKEEESEEGGGSGRGRRQRPRKRGRWARQQEEWDELTVGIKKEEEGDVGIVVVKEED